MKMDMQMIQTNKYTGKMRKENDARRVWHTNVVSQYVGTFVTSTNKPDMLVRA